MTYPVPRPQALRAGGLFDGERAIGRGMVVIDGGRIVDVDTTGAAPPTAAEVVDLGEDAWILPGLIDTHVHLAFDATADVVATVTTANDETVLEGMRAAAARALRAGITTVRDLGDRDYLSLRLRREWVGRPHAGPHIVASGPPITTPGGHCHFLGGEAAGAGALRAAVRARHERGCEVVKVMVSGGVMTPGSAAHASQFGLADLRVVVEEAHRLGMSTAGHAHAGSAIGDALEAGFDSLEHVTFITEDGVAADARLVERIARRGVVVGTTVGKLPGARAVSAATTGRRAGIDQVRAELYLAGARMSAGTDAGIAPDKPHDVLPYGIAHLVDVIGMRPHEALKAATVVAAEACGLSEVKGRLRAGMDADLVVVGRDPLADMSALRDVRAVYRAGHRVVGGQR
ncbi:amidohydrolase family protein [Alloactinosynnema sp. L-07]|uniref:amidohydrolase family protein n=1 Tax=Alloactinosynnema sp. L-07 TaxID=1653480 RepID=UPI0006B56ECA|nr:amidohydrolase family protein [Alloactinosynnema sp. L-07]